MKETFRYEEVLQRVVAIVAKEMRISPETIGETTLLFEQLGADSLDAVSIALSLEQEFEIRIPNEEIRNFRTPGAIVAGIQSTVSG